MNNLINRLGFDSWASNLAVNLIENGELKDGYRYECDQYSISVNEINETGKHMVFIRAYVSGSGWQTSEQTY
jgi:hypothetical protein